LIMKIPNADEQRIRPALADVYPGGKEILPLHRFDILDLFKLVQVGGVQMKLTHIALEMIALIDLDIIKDGPIKERDHGEHGQTRHTQEDRQNGKYCPSLASGQVAK